MSLPPPEWSETEPAAREEAPVPWENPELASLPALGLTLWQLLTRPRRFFHRLSWDGDLGDPLGFALVLGSLGLLASLSWHLLQVGPGSNPLLNNLLGKVLGDEPELLVLAGVLLGLPLVVAAEQYFSSFCLYAAGRLFEPAFTFRRAFRILAYAHAALVFSLLPWVGGLASGAYSLILVLTGLQTTGFYSWGRSAAVLLVSLFLQSLLLLLAFLLAGAWLVGRFWFSLFS